MKSSFELIITLNIIFFFYFKLESNASHFPISAYSILNELGKHEIKK